MNKKIIASLLISGMLLVGGTTASATSVPQSTTWVSQTIGKSYDFDGALGYQCFDYVNQYAHDLFGTSFPGEGAIDLLTTGNRNGFRVIRAGNGTPQPGDIFILSTPGNPNGHTGVVISSDSTGMIVADQNYNGRSYVSQHRINYQEPWSQLVGWVRPPFEASGWTTINGQQVYINSDGQYATGEQKIDGQYYYFDPNSHSIVKGFLTLPDGRKVYYDDQGHMVHGEALIDGNFYLFEKYNGGMQTGLQDLTTYGANKTVYYDPKTGHMLYGDIMIDGVMHTFEGGSGKLIDGNWRTVDGHQRYLQTDGQYASGEQIINGKTYYFDVNTHDLILGLTTLPDGRKVYLDDQGQISHGEVKIGQYFYLFDAQTGEMKTGLQDLTSYGANKTVYYDPETGHMLYGDQIIDGKTYSFEAGTGKLIANVWRTVGENKQYLGADGQLASGEQSIDGKTYYFDPSTHNLMTGLITLANGQKIYADEQG